MIIKRISSCLLLFLALFFDSKLNSNEHESPEYVRYFDEIVSVFAKQIKREFGLDCQGIGGSMPYDVEEVVIKFAAYRRATVDEARELEVAITERLVKMINAHEKIRPFLREYPFPPNRTRVGISFYQPNNKPYVDGSVSYVSHVKNIIFYDAENLNNPYIDDTIHEEPYEEALKIVQSNVRGNP